MAGPKLPRGSWPRNPHPSLRMNRWPCSDARSDAGTDRVRGAWTVEKIAGTHRQIMGAGNTSERRGALVIRRQLVGQRQHWWADVVWAAPTAATRPSTIRLCATVFFAEQRTALMPAVLHANWRSRSSQSCETSTLGTLPTEYPVRIRADDGATLTGSPR